MCQFETDFSTKHLGQIWKLSIDSPISAQLCFHILSQLFKHQKNLSWPGTFTFGTNMIFNCCARYCMYGWVYFLMDEVIFCWGGHLSILLINTPYHFCLVSINIMDIEFTSCQIILAVTFYVHLSNWSEPTQPNKYICRVQVMCVKR